MINTAPVIIVAKKDLPPNSLKEFVAYLRANEKSVTEADAGVGSVSHLACSVFKSLIAVQPPSPRIGERRRPRRTSSPAMSISCAIRSSMWSGT